MNTLYNAFFRCSKKTHYHLILYRVQNSLYFWKCVQKFLILNDTNRVFEGYGQLKYVLKNILYLFIHARLINLNWFFCCPSIFILLLFIYCVTIHFSSNAVQTVTDGNLLLIPYFFSSLPATRQPLEITPSFILFSSDAVLTITDWKFIVNTSWQLLVCTYPFFIVLLRDYKVSL